MSDETGYTNDRDKYRRDESGQLTVWGARNAVAVLVHQVATEVAALGPERVDDVLAATARRVHQALDDVEDAYLRAHDRFGCTGLSGVRDNDEPRRYECQACERERGVVESLVQLRDGAVVPALTAREERMRDMLREAFAERGGGVGEDTLAHLARRACEAAGYEAPADSRDEEDVEVNEAMREAGRRHRQMLVDADVVRRRIRSGVPEPRDPSWDAVRDVRQLRDSDGPEACYDRPQAAGQEDQVDARDDQAEVLVGCVGWDHVGLREVLNVSAGDQLNLTLESGDDGRLLVRSLYVMRAAELADEDDEDEVTGVDISGEIGD
jgi:hypothetical protein